MHSVKKDSISLCAGKRYNSFNMKILITGLCLQGNKGGAALAQSLKVVLNDEFPGADFIYSVPVPEFKQEKIWGEKLGMDVVKKISIKDFVPPWCFKSASMNKRNAFMRALRGADLVVDMTALTYVGPPKGNVIGSLQTRFLYFLLASLTRKRFLAWTQTYGPFSSFLMRVMARADLKRQPIVFCRGRDCERAVQALLPGKQTRVYPDVACALPYNSADGSHLLRKWIGADMNLKFASLSPSAVLYTSTVGKGLDNMHVRFCEQIYQALKARGYTVILIPHTYRPKKVNPNSCDKAVCDLVQQKLSPDEVTIIDDDLSASELKSIISNMEIHIGGRYHSIIAALSSSVPCISLSWHPKYRDAMEFYDVGDFVLKADKPFSESNTEILLDKLEHRQDEISQSLAARQSEICRSIKENVESFAAIYREL